MKITAILIPLFLFACTNAESKDSKDENQDQSKTANVSTSRASTPETPPVDPAAEAEAARMAAEIATPPSEAKTTASGLVYHVVKAGTGTDHPKATDSVEVHYSGWTLDGKMFDSSVQRGRPASFPLSGVIRGWTEGVQLMVEGEKARFWIPAELAYGDTPRRPGAPSGKLVFDIELLRVIRPPETPKDVAAVPNNAKKTASGLAYRVLTPGKGQRKPLATDTVEVHYSGWTTDGKMFDSSSKRGRPAKFPLNGVIKGWTEGVQLMVEGEKTRFWIPAGLAYGDTPTRPGAPFGMLVFDIELLSIQ